MEKLLIVIPARYGSSRFPGKVIYPIKGKPMLQYVWESAKAVGLPEVDVVIATDDERVARVVETFGGRVVMTSSDCQSGSDRCAQVVKDREDIDWVINIQADEPLIKSEVIRSFIEGIIRFQPKMASLYTDLVVDDAQDPNIVKVVLDENDFALYFSRSAIPYFKTGAGYYYQHIGIYGYSRDFLLEFNSWPKTKLEQAESLEQLRAIEKGVKIKMFYTKYCSVGVDVPEDIKKVEELLGGGDA